MIKFKKMLILTSLSLLAVPIISIVSCSDNKKSNNIATDSNKEKPLTPEDNFIPNLPDDLNNFYNTKIKKIPREIASTLSQDDLLKQLDLLKGQFERETLSQIKMDYSTEISKLSQFIEDKNIKNTFLKYMMNPVFSYKPTTYPNQAFYFEHSLDDTKMSYGLDDRDFSSELVKWDVYPDTSMYQYHTMSSYSMTKNDIVNNLVREVGIKTNYKEPSKKYVIYSTPIKYIKSYFDITVSPRTRKYYEVYSKDQSNKIVINETLITNPEIIREISGKEDFIPDPQNYVYSFDSSFIYDNVTMVDSGTTKLGELKLNGQNFPIFQTPKVNTIQKEIDFSDSEKAIDIVSKGQIFDFEKFKTQIDRLTESKKEKLVNLYKLVTGDTDLNPATIEVDHFVQRNYKDLIDDKIKVDSEDAANQNILSKSLVESCTDGDTFRDLYPKKNSSTELKTGVSVRIAGFDTPEKKGAQYRFADNWLQYHMGQYATNQCEKILTRTEKDTTDPKLSIFYIYRNGLDKYSRQLGYVLKSDYTSYVAEMVANGAGVAATIENEPWLVKSGDFYGFKEEIVYAQLYAAYNRKGIFSEELWKEANDWIKTHTMKDASGKSIPVPIRADAFKDYKSDIWYKAPKQGEVDLGLIYPTGRSWSSQYFGFAHPYLTEQLIEDILNY